MFTQGDCFHGRMVWPQWAEEILTIQQARPKLAAAPIFVPPDTMRETISETQVFVFFHLSTLYYECG